MGNRLSWPPLRTDLMAVACLGFVAYCAIANRWEPFAIAALVGAIFCAVSPRMKGRFGFRSGKGNSVGGEFANPDGESPVGVKAPD